MSDEYTKYNQYDFIKEVEFDFVKEEKFEHMQANQEALAAFISANPTLDEGTQKLAAFIIALKGSA